MDIFDFYFKQIVTQSQMDWAFDQVQDSLHSVSLDNEFVGIVTGMDAQQHAAIPDKNVDVTGPGIAYDPEGQRCHVPDLLTVVDCSQDEFGTSTDPPTVAFERYLSIFIRFNRNLTEPALDGNNVVVYTKQLESFEFFVRQGAEAPAGTAIPAPLMTDAVLVCDILVAHGFTAILNADFDLARRQDWVRFTGAVLGDRVYGTAKEAVDDLLALIESWGGSLPFAFTSTWFAATPVAGPTPPPTTMQESLDAIVYDLAQTGAVPPSGAALVGTADFTSIPGGYVSWVTRNVERALQDVGNAIDGHVSGGPPAHPAAAIVFTPYSYLASTDVQAAIQELVDDLADATATSGASRIGNDAYSWIAATTLRTQIREIVDDLSAVGAGTSGASLIGTEPIAGAPESIGASDVMAVLTAVYGHLNARTERSIAETVDGAWTFDNGLLASSALRDANNLRFRNAPLFKSIKGGSCPPGSQKGNLASGLPMAGTPWGVPWSGPNQLAIGAGANVGHMTMTYDAATSELRRLVISDDTTFSLAWMDPEDPLVFGVIPIAPYFPAAVYGFVGLASDEKYVYIKVLDIGTGQYYVNAIDLTGTVRPGWPALGTLLPGTGGSPLTPPNYNGNICVAQLDGAEQYATSIASLNEWQNGGSNAMVTILNGANGLILASGDGDVPLLPGPTVVANCYPQGGLVSDGTNLWFTWKDSTATTGGVASATIAVPGVGTGFAGLPYAIPSADSNQLIYDGAMIWYCDWNGDIWIYRIADQAWDRKAGTGLGAVKFAAFDGLNVWLQVLEAAGSSWEIYMIPAASVRAVGSGTQLTAGMVRFIASMMQSSEAGTVAANVIGPVCFDGDSVWMIMETVAATSLAGKIRRLPRAGLR